MVEKTSNTNSITENQDYWTQPRYESTRTSILFVILLTSRKTNYGYSLEFSPTPSDSKNICQCAASGGSNFTRRSVIRVRYTQWSLLTNDIRKTGAWSVLTCARQTVFSSLPSSGYHTLKTGIASLTPRSHTKDRPQACLTVIEGHWQREWM